MKQFDITVKIRVSVTNDSSMSAEDQAQMISQRYADMALNYKSIAADAVMKISVEKV